MTTWQVGDIRITRILELEVTGGLGFVLPQATREAVQPYQWMYPHFMDEKGRLKASVHALVIEAGDRRIIVDTCIGNDKDRPHIPAWDHMQGPFLRDLAAAGFAPDTIDTVLCTHLHVDHVGWNTMLVDGRWVPTFPKARYLLGRVEFEHWRGQTAQADQVTVFADSVQPVFEAGLVDLVETDHVVCAGVRLVPTLGHTPGHVSIAIESQGEAALITGDFIHHPCQLARPDWAAIVDSDQTQSTATRHAMFGQLAETPTLVIGTHFATPTAGHIVRDGDAYRLKV
ncbi:MBL fold metallo-hydrolase [Zavarzinia sp. CC-PAN008]|uniref:MBL fold metallo-hydrolase n=1 Tax=Zavarzinia sp. CC-PAN008 TaxID=3243332 RepID=UPI003F74945B